MRLLPLLALLPLSTAALFAPLVAPSKDAQVIPGKYIVVLKPDASQSAFSRVIDFLGDRLDHVYEIGTFRGVAGSLSQTLLMSIQNLGFVDYIEQDTIVRTAALKNQRSAPWGLGRISHREKGSTNYKFHRSAGKDTCSYIIDTGIYTKHPDFEGRANFLENFSGDCVDEDGNGHGTHVAGTVLGANGSGSNSGVIAGIAFAAKDAKAREASGACKKGSVANLSLGGVISTAQMRAVRGAVDSGLFLAVAAGNSGLPTVLFSPANEESACTVGATDKDDNRAYFSNFGTLVDVMAPGVDVESTWNDGKTKIISGTSMASPHVAGLGAYLLSLEHRRNPRDLCQRIQDLSTKDRLWGLDFITENYLAFNGVSP